MPSFTSPIRTAGVWSDRVCACTTRTSRREIAALAVMLTFQRVSRFRKPKAKRSRKGDPCLPNELEQQLLGSRFYFFNLWHNTGLVCGCVGCVLCAFGIRGFSIGARGDARKHLDGGGSAAAVASCICLAGSCHCIWFLLV